VTVRLSRKGHTLRRRLPRPLRPRTLVRAAVAAQVARTVLTTEERTPHSPHGLAALDQYVAAARHELDLRGVDLSSPSDLATAIIPLAAMIEVAEDDSADELQLAAYGVLRALSAAFDDAVGGVR
jgi:hypothetical protein